MGERERVATETAGNGPGAPMGRASVRDLRVLAARLGNAAFGLARAASPGGVFDPSVRALTAASGRALMRTPLADAVHAVGSGPFTAAFALLAGNSVNATNTKLRALDTPDLVALRAHLAGAPAADRPRISTALDQAEVIPALVNRIHVLGEADLTQPPAAPAAVPVP